jgi:membrane fusion protein, multidrug efflux system
MRYDKSEIRGRQFDRSHSALNLLDDSLKTNTDHNDLRCSAAESNSRNATDIPKRSRTLARIRDRPVLLAALLGGLLAIVYVGIRLWNYFQSYERTNEAQVDSSVSPISSRISGTVARVYVEDYQRVKPGQLLVQLDSRDFQVAVEQARAQLAQAEAAVNAGRQEYAFELAETHEDQAREVEARRTAQRYSALLRLGVVSRAQYDQFSAVAGEQAVDVRADQADTAVALDNIAARQDEVEAAKVRLHQAIVNLGFVSIVAPADGIIGPRNVEIGQRVGPGQSLMTLIQVNDLWVTARFKETQLGRMRREQAVTIHVDAIGHDFRGHVQSTFEEPAFPPGLLASENATINDVTLVRIAFDPGQDFTHLRPGMSADLTVWLN